MTRPRSGLRNPIIKRKLTDFPTPLRPRIQSVCPGKTPKLTSSRTLFEPKDFET
jgi:hypothetical protein